jgi:hypothetical protein
MKVVPRTDLISVRRGLLSRSVETGSRIYGGEASINDDYAAGPCIVDGPCSSDLISPSH